MSMHYRNEIEQAAHSLQTTAMHSHCLLTLIEVSI